MGSWVSKDGVWKPAIERVAVYDKNGDPTIYEGPDRSAMEYLKETGETHLGMHFTEDPDIIERAHERKMTVDQFCKTAIHTEEKRKADYEAKAAIKVNHKAPERKPAQKQTQTGGTNTAGAGHLEGGFTESTSSPVTEAIAKTKVK